jgi:hypothetical protein
MVLGLFFSIISCGENKKALLRYQKGFKKL